MECTCPNADPVTKKHKGGTYPYDHVGVRIGLQDKAARTAHFKTHGFTPTSKDTSKLPSASNVVPPATGAGGKGRGRGSSSQRGRSGPTGKGKGKGRGFSIKALRTSDRHDSNLSVSQTESSLGSKNSEEKESNPDALVTGTVRKRVTWSTNETPVEDFDWSSVNTEMPSVNNVVNTEMPAVSNIVNTEMPSVKKFADYAPVEELWYNQLFKVMEYMGTLDTNKMSRAEVQALVDTNFPGISERAREFSLKSVQLKPAVAPPYSTQSYLDSDDEDTNDFLSSLEQASEFSVNYTRLEKHSMFNVSYLDQRFLRPVSVGMSTPYNSTP